MGPLGTIKAGVLTRLPVCKSHQSLQVREVRRDTVSCAVHVKKAAAVEGDRKTTQEIRGVAVRLVIPSDRRTS